jgi:hypothetical protein
MRKLFIAFLVAATLLFGACASQQPAPTATPQPSGVPEQAATPSAQAQQQPAQPASTIEETVKPLLGQAATRVKSLVYKYKGPETQNQVYDFYVKGTKMAYYNTDKNEYGDPDAYNVIYLDTAAKTAASYCTHQTCVPKGKRSDLTYSAVSIATPLDWVSGITSAKKVGEEQIERRSTIIVDTNKGKMWIETYYGVPMQVEKDGTLYQYQQMAFNSVTDAQVTP